MAAKVHFDPDKPIREKSAVLNKPGLLQTMVAQTDHDGTIKEMTRALGEASSSRTLAVPSAGRTTMMTGPLQRTQAWRSLPRRHSTQPSGVELCEGGHPRLRPLREKGTGLGAAGQVLYAPT